MAEDTSKIDIRYIAHLARLQLTPAEEAQFGAQLQQILGYVAKLAELDVAGVEPMAHVLPLVNVLRADEVRPSLSSEVVLQNAPEQARGLFIVPKIVE